MLHCCMVIGHYLYIGTWFVSSTQYTLIYYNIDKKGSKYEPVPFTKAFHFTGNLVIIIFHI